MREIVNVGVVGAGQMGHGIAQVAAQAGYRVLLQDVYPEALQRARGNIGQNLQKGVQLGKVAPEAAQAASGRLELTTSLEDVAKSDFIVESAPEDMELKADIFRRLDELAAPDVIITSNTSAKSVTRLAGATRRPGLVAGMHFFNPVHLMKLVEIIRALETAPATIETVRQVAARMGKETVVIKDFPGFATSRVSALLGNEAFHMLQEGLGSPEDIDKALQLGLNLPMGPLALGDLVGLDTRLKVLEYLQENLGERYRPCPLMRQYVEAGRLGRKAGKGVYDYPVK